MNKILTLVALALLIAACVKTTDDKEPARTLSLNEMGLDKFKANARNAADQVQWDLPDDYDTSDYLPDTGDNSPDTIYIPPATDTDTDTDTDSDIDSDADSDSDTTGGDGVITCPNDSDELTLGANCLAFASAVRECCANQEAATTMIATYICQMNASEFMCQDVLTDQVSSICSNSLCSSK